jgi:hypothetical protein
VNRRSFLKFLGIGTATAAVAPKMLAAQPPEVYPEANYPITLEMLQKAYAKTLQPTMHQAVGFLPLPKSLQRLKRDA